jgi:hypothetical protein
MAEILRFRDFLNEKKKEINEFLYFEDGILFINVEHLCQIIGLTCVDSEIAVDTNPEIEDADYNFDLTVEIAEDLKSLNLQEIKKKIKNIITKISEYIKDIKINIIDNVLDIAFARNLKVATI